MRNSAVLKICLCNLIIKTQVLQAAGPIEKLHSRCDIHPSRPLWKNKDHFKQYPDHWSSFAASRWRCLCLLYHFHLWAEASCWFPKKSSSSPSPPSGAAVAAAATCWLYSTRLLRENSELSDYHSTSCWWYTTPGSPPPPHLVSLINVHSHFVLLQRVLSKVLQSSRRALPPGWRWPYWGAEAMTGMCVLHVMSWFEAEVLTEGQSGRKNCIFFQAKTCLKNPG